MTRVVESIRELRGLCEVARCDGGCVGLVPTMGYLHEGHRSLMRAARRDNDLVVTSVFVNPLQFGAGEDLDAYPRDLDADLGVCRETKVDVLFHPSVAEMYPHGRPATTVHVEGLTDDLCGKARPTHFDGVTTVVAKLFAIVGPCRAYFGTKDYQQLVVVRRMAADLDLGVEVVGCPIVREADGVAMSSRNAYLSDSERAAAPALFAALEAGAIAVQSGERRSDAVRRLVMDRLSSAPEVEPEYVEVRSAADLSPVRTLDGRVVIALAARVGPARLIDNIRITLGADDGEVEVDAGVRLGG